MASTFPTSLDTFTNPTATSLLTSPSHSLSHSDLNDAVEALETKVGIGNTVLGSYISFATTLTNVTVGDGVISGSYCRVNGFVHYYGSFTLGSTSAVTGTVSFTLPVNLNSDMNIRSTYGTFQYLDGSSRYNGQSQRNTDSSLNMCVDLTSGTYAQSSLVGSTTPFTWAVGDVMTWNLYYRAA
jgi:hypothetical protein